MSLLSALRSTNLLCSARSLARLRVANKAVLIIALAEMAKSKCICSNWASFAIQMYGSHDVRATHHRYADSISKVVFAVERRFLFDPNSAGLLHHAFRQPSFNLILLKPSGGDDLLWFQASLIVQHKIPATVASVRTRRMSMPNSTTSSGEVQRSKHRLNWNKSIKSCMRRRE